MKYAYVTRSVAGTRYRGIGRRWTRGLGGFARPEEKNSTPSVLSSNSNLNSNQTHSTKPALQELNSKTMKAKDEVKPKPKTIAQQDEELRLKLEGISGEGGSAGIEYEGGKAVGLKRGVRENMFRVI